MIDPKELMLNNVVLAPKMFLGNCSTDECNEMVFYKVVFVSSVFSNRFEPVELTPEILEAVGCVKDIIDGWNLWINGNLFVIRKLVSAKGYTLSVGDYCLCDIEYLHTFQNAYNLLTGQELQIDLQKLNKQP